MQNITYLIDSTNNGFSPLILDIIYIISILFTISIIVSKNPIISILSLIGLFFCIACYLIILGLSFIGLSYILVYVGAVSILFLFILMLINIRVSELAINSSNSIPLVFVISIISVYTLIKLLPSDTVSIYNIYKSIVPFLDFFKNIFNDQNTYYDYYSVGNDIHFVTSKSWDSNIAESSHITSIGNIMYTSYFIWLILTSIILLLAMVGCIVITIKDNVKIN